MGYYTFRWPPGARDVVVTGDFDAWTGSLALHRAPDGGFQREVLLPDRRVLYKFIVDGSWLTDPDAPQETDAHNNANSVLLPALHHRSPLMADHFAPAALSSAAPHSSTAALAKDVPLESKQQTPGTFPETPMDDHAHVNPFPPSGQDKSVTTDKESYEKGGSDPTMLSEGQQQFSANPLPATGTVGNPSSSAVQGKSVASNVTTDKDSYEKGGSDPTMLSEGQQEFSVNPLPATGTVGNPSSSAIQGKSVASNVTTDKDSYDRGGSDPAMLSQMQHAHDQKNTLSALPADASAQSRSLGPNDNPTIQSAAPASTTAALAAAVPLEKHAASSYDPSHPARQVPDVVRQSMSKADADPEAAGDPEMVSEKKDLEKELLSEVPPATGSGQPAPLMASGALLPNVVKESMHKADASPEAAAVPAMISEKKDLEKELLSEVPPATGSGQPAPLMASGALLPNVVKESMHKADASPEAAAVPAMISEKKDLEKELLSEVPPATGSGQPAPTTSAALASTAPTTSSSTDREPQRKQAGDLSPKTRDEPSASMVPSALDETKAAAEPEPVTTVPSTTVPATTVPSVVPAAVPASTVPAATVPATTAPASSETRTTPAGSTDTERKKRHRISGFINKLKEKFA